MKQLSSPALILRIDFLSFDVKGELNNSERSLLQVQAPGLESRAEVTVSDMCRVFAVQVRCMPVSGAGYWSEWSHVAYSTPQNSRGTLRFTLKP